MDQSSTVQATFRCDDLDHRDLGLCRLVADRVHHPCRLECRSRAWSIMQRARQCAPATRSGAPRGPPKATRLASRLHISSSARSASPIERNAWWMRPVRAGPVAIRSRALRPAGCSWPEPGRCHRSSCGRAARRRSEHIQRPHDRHSGRVRRTRPSTAVGDAGASGSVLPMTCRSCSADRPRRCPPLAAVDDVAVALPPDGRLDVSCVRRRPLRARFIRETPSGARPASSTGLSSASVPANRSFDRFHVAGVRWPTI